jgi:hypothetical protein
MSNRFRKTPQTIAGYQGNFMNKRYRNSKPRPIILNQDEVSLNDLADKQPPRNTKSQSGATRKQMFDTRP